MSKSRSCCYRAPFVESLESRQFLAVDLALNAASTANLASAGAKTGNITIKNTGTVTINGPVTVTFSAKPATGGAVQTLGTKTLTLAKFKPNASKGFSGIKLTAPTGSGKFNITAKITVSGDSKPGNNSKAAGSVTLKSTGGGTNTGSNGQAVFGSAQVGTKLKFKKTGILPGNGVMGFVHEKGTFTDEKGNSGTYELALPPVLSSVQPPQLLSLSFKSAGISRQYTLTFTPVAKRFGQGLNGKTVSFSTSAAGAAAKGTIISTFLPTVYLKY